MVRLVCFDFWNTLYENIPNNPKKEYTYNLIYDAFNKKISINQITEYMKKFDTVFNDNKQYTNLNRIEFLEKNFHLFLLKQDKLNLDKKISEAVIKYPPILDNEVINFLKFLKRRKYNIILVSDTNYSYGESIRKILESDGILGYFDCLIFSDETNLRKPNPKIFQFICKRFNVTPNQCLFIGDSEEKDIIGPKNQGFYTAKKCNNENFMSPSKCNIKFTSFSDLQKEFIRGGIFYGI